MRVTSPVGVSVAMSARLAIAGQLIYGTIAHTRKEYDVTPTCDLQQMSLGSVCKQHEGQKQGAPCSARPGSA